MAYTQQNLFDGQIVINTFLKKFLKYNGYSISFNELVSKVTTGDKTRFLQILGNYYSLVGKDSALLDDSMDNLASETRGGVPTSQGFFDSLRENYDSYKYVKQALSDSASEIGGIASDFGKGSLELIKFVSGNIGLIVIAGIAGFIYFNRESFKFSKDELLGALKGAKR